jgi:hypothetical protein
MAGTSRGAQGGNTGSVELSQRARNQRKARAQRQARYWASRSGPVKLSQLTARHGMGVCYWCGCTILEGSPIALYVESAASKWWGHSECVQAAKGVAM